MKLKEIVSLIVAPIFVIGFVTFMICQILFIIGLVGGVWIFETIKEKMKGKKEWEI